jgi:hypothetical protein
VLSSYDIARVMLGHVTRPAEEALARQQIALAAYVIHRPRGLFLLYTGMVEHIEPNQCARSLEHEPAPQLG